ncbi:alpha/beta hydrolase [Caldivirga maquilingensis]|uniref:Putative esterase n=1 Tax=Caldivirga maquilingensis (strain ATCC 700844 / DSM 13496 / JCM 10307 / IC-167) TaxID=397948 RepID=A8ME37_CALMQ|nr:alpha/beta hydrolase [Caldivirga maquilingensis]ABW02043.1 putative esterase [Caldivirga maquilingensis IC-167]
MRIEVIRLRDDRPVTLTSYILDTSPEISWGRRPAIIICPGGGFVRTSDREAEPVASIFLSRGYHAFVLRYSTESMGVSKVYPDVVIELANAVVSIRRNADKWNIDPGRIAIIGFSAGGTVAALYSVNWHRDWLSKLVNAPKDTLKPSAVILAYPVVDFAVMNEVTKNNRNTPAAGVLFKMMSLALGSGKFTEDDLRELSATYHVDENTPPTFIWTTADDDVVPVESIISYVNALARNKVPFEFHVFEKGVHGLSLADKTTASNPQHVNPPVAKWIELALSWLERHIE